ncbi:hypothetical protein Pcinc_035567, partial [Petrolisthes cinctipes]
NSGDSEGALSQALALRRLHHHVGLQGGRPNPRGSLGRQAEGEDRHDANAVTSHVTLNHNTIVKAEGREAGWSSVKWRRTPSVSCLCEEKS